MGYRTQLANIRDLIDTIDLSEGVSIKQKINEMTLLLVSVCPDNVLPEDFAAQINLSMKQLAGELRVLLGSFKSQVNYANDIINQIKPECTRIKTELRSHVLPQDIDGTPTISKELLTYKNSMVGEIDTMDVELDTPRDAISAELVSSFSRDDQNF